MMKILFLLTGLIFVSFTANVSAFDIQTDGKQYQIVSYGKGGLYTYVLEDEDLVLAYGTLRISGSNGDQIQDLPYQDVPGTYTWSWYEDRQKTQLLDSITWTVKNATKPVAPVSEILLTVNTDARTYEEDDIITVSGTALPYEWANAVSIQLVNEKLQLVEIDQLVPDSEGYYEARFGTESAVWKTSNQITVRATYLEQTVTTDFDFKAKEEIPKISGPLNEKTQPNEEFNEEQIQEFKKKIERFELKARTVEEKAEEAEEEGKYQRANYLRILVDLYELRADYLRSVINE